MRNTPLEQQPEESAELIELKEPVELVESEVTKELGKPVGLVGPVELVESGELEDPKKSEEPVEPASDSEHDAISVELPIQSLPPNRGGVQALARTFLAHEQERSQSDHSPHSCHLPSIP